MAKALDQRIWESARSKPTTTVSTLFVALAVHKESITVAYALEELGAEATLLGNIGTRLT